MHAIRQVEFDPGYSILQLLTRMGSIGRSRGCTRHAHPPRVPILFDIQILRNVTASGVHPPTRSTPPHGKSWIRHLVQFFSSSILLTVGENLLHLEDLTALENLPRPLDLELHGNPFICDFEHCWLRKEYR